MNSKVHDITDSQDVEHVENKPVPMEMWVVTYADGDIYPGGSFPTEELAKAQVRVCDHKCRSLAPHRIFHMVEQL